MQQLRTGLRWGVGVLVAVGLLGMPTGILANDGAVPPESRTFGTASPITHTIHAFAFMPEVPETR